MVHFWYDGNSCCFLSTTYRSRDICTHRNVIQNLQWYLGDFHKRSIALHPCKTQSYARQVLQTYCQAHEQ